MRDERLAGVRTAGEHVDDAGGTSASSAIRPSHSEVNGVCSAGLRMTVLPVASAGAILHAPLMNGSSTA
jgi:hypothetical protein